MKLCSTTSSDAHASALATLAESDVDELVLLIKNDLHICSTTPQQLMIMINIQSSIQYINSSSEEDVVMSHSSQLWNLVVWLCALAASAMHAERTENLRQRELKLFFFEFHAWYYY